MKRICSIEGCGSPRLARGWCSKHYQRWQSKGNAGWEPPAHCTIADCERPVYGYGWCNAHYARWRRHGNHAADTPLRAQDAETTFLANTERRGDCLAWTGDMSSRGYGRITVDGKRIGAHRYSWERANGPIPDGSLIDHICHTTACVEPTHLRTASAAGNMQNRSGAQKNSTTGARNVYRRGEKFLVQIVKDRQAHCLGTYPTIEQAAAVAEAARRDLFGAYAGKG